MQVAMLTILEVNDRHSATAHDARGYQIAKLAFMQDRADQRYVVIQPDTGTWTEARGREVIIEHLEAPERFGDTRALNWARRLRELIQLHRPSVIQCNSPAVVPLVAQLASARLSPRPAVIGYWHGDLTRVDRRRGAEAWWLDQWSQRGYAGLDAVFVPSKSEARMLRARGIDRLFHTPLGVDATLYSPARREPGRVGRLRAGLESRLIVWTDADRRTLAPIDAELCRRSTHDPALVLAGPEDQASARAHVHGPALGSAIERAECLAACDLGLLLGAATTCVEAMASALPIVAVGGGHAGVRAAELVRESSCGRTVGDHDPRAIAEALLALARDPERAELGRRGRRFVARYDWASCFERELACVAEVLDHVRHGRRVPADIHERMQPAALWVAE